MEGTRTGTKNVLEVVGFSLDEKVYALEIGLVREVVLYQPAMSVPDSPPYVEGVIDLRGEVIPVIDLRKRLNLSAARAPQHIIIAQAKGRATGLVVDRVSEVIHIAADQMQGPERFKGSGAERFFHGVGRDRNRLIFVLAFEKLVAWKDGSLAPERR